LATGAHSEEINEREDTMKRIAYWTNRAGYMGRTEIADYTALRVLEMRLIAEGYHLVMVQ